MATIHKGQPVGNWIQLVAHRYQKEDSSLAKAAELAGVSWAQMRDILLEKGVQPRLGPRHRW